MSIVGQYRIRELGLIDETVQPKRFQHYTNNWADNLLPRVYLFCGTAFDRRSIQHLIFPGIRIGIPDPSGIGDNPAVEPDMRGSRALVFVPLRRLVEFRDRIGFVTHKPIRFVRRMALSKVPVLRPGEVDKDLSFGNVLDGSRTRRRISAEHDAVLPGQGAVDQPDGGFRIRGKLLARAPCYADDRPGRKGAKSRNPIVVVFIDVPLEICEDPFRARAVLHLARGNRDAAVITWGRESIERWRGVRSDIPGVVDVDDGRRPRLRCIALLVGRSVRQTTRSKAARDVRRVVVERAGHLPLGGTVQGAVHGACGAISPERSNLLHLKVLEGKVAQSPPSVPARNLRERHIQPIVG